MDPRSNRVVWSFSTPRLFSHFRGAAQQLPNGNVLITESDRGHVLEVTRARKKVWEFWNPDVDESGSEPQRAAIYRMVRYPRSHLRLEM